MKKIWIVAVVACAALMVACGGEKKESKETPKVSVVTQAAIYTTALNTAVGNDVWENDYIWMSIIEDMDKYATSLSESELEQFNIVCNQLYSPTAREAIEMLAAQNAM